MDSLGALEVIIPSPTLKNNSRNIKESLLLHWGKGKRLGQTLSAKVNTFLHLVIKSIFVLCKV